MAPIGSVVVERSEKVSATGFPALSVGKRGVTPQLEGVAKTQTDGDRKLVRAGDLVINSRSDRRGASGLARQDGSVSLVYSVMTPKPGVLLAEYGHHLLRSTAFQEEFFRWGTGIVDDLWSTNFTRMSRIHIPLPPPAVQRSIAHHLDQIDAMIGKLDDLTEQLAAHHRTNLVTLGRQLVAPGERTRVGLLLMKQSRDARPGDGVVTAFRDGQVTLRSRRREEGFTMSISEVGYQGVEPGDFVFHGLDGFSGAVGVSEDRGKVSPVYHVCNATPLASERFMAWALRALAANGFLEAYATSVRQRSVDFRNWTTFAGLPITYIPLEEQQRIADHLDEVSGRINVMLASAAKLRELLVERSSAFITDVVTGKKEVA
jgi:type I restriction enzyme S subunit